ncbi:MAG: CvpA family protein [Saprospiraceae bacterium]|jgi:uncharacterized membrane protein required for colicin V production|nr:CvpA family protein [Saprospiraceae bacterium]MCA0332920.1 CvpA family protein [Bacteroidota bacterium]MCB0603568.1 CvpA family protein [Saprospiraceae bacterium]HMT76546.1 CvpA family protein [Saprospiraceae bacterium]HQU96301.1 CvpA family protein [Saprospiraceae bacterium]
MVVDIILVLLISLAFYVGYINGVLGVVLKILLVIGAILLALKLFPIVFLFMENTFTNITLVYFILGFLLVLAIDFFIYRFLSRKIEGWVKANSMKLITKISGGLMLSFFILILVSFVSGRLMGMKIINKATFENSAIFPAVEKIDYGFTTLLDKTKDVFNKSFENNIKTINDIDHRQKSDSTQSQH